MVPRVSLIVPTFNEAPNVAPLLERIAAALAGVPHETLIVDDHSPDGTGAIVEGAAKEDPSVRLIARKTERGLSSAVVAGWKSAVGEVLGALDADLSHDPMILPQLLRALDEGAEIAIGSRWIPGGGVEGWPWHRRAGSRMAARMACTLLGVRTSDPMSGYFLMKRSLWERCAPRLAPKGFKILLEVLARSRTRRIAEVPYVFRNRVRGKSKVTAGVAVDYLRMLRELRKCR